MDYDALGNLTLIILVDSGGKRLTATTMPVMLREKPLAMAGFIPCPCLVFGIQLIAWCTTYVLVLIQGMLMFFTTKTTSIAIIAWN